MSASQNNNHLTFVIWATRPGSRDSKSSIRHALEILVIIAGMAFSIPKLISGGGVRVLEKYLNMRRFVFSPLVSSHHSFDGM